MRFPSPSLVTRSNTPWAVGLAISLIRSSRNKRSLRGHGGSSEGVESKCRRHRRFLVVSSSSFSFSACHHSVVVVLVLVTSSSSYSTFVWDHKLGYLFNISILIVLIYCWSFTQHIYVRVSFSPVLECVEVDCWNRVFPSPHQGVVIVVIVLNPTSWLALWFIIWTPIITTQR